MKPKDIITNKFVMFRIKLCLKKVMFRMLRRLNEATPNSAL